MKVTVVGAGAVGAIAVCVCMVAISSFAPKKVVPPALDRVRSAGAGSGRPLHSPPD